MCPPRTCPGYGKSVILLVLIRRLAPTFCQTKFLPLDDRDSVTYREYLAEIDVSMGGRIAEELSKFFSSY
jgi:ATP-dependent Zn protease